MNGILPITLEDALAGEFGDNAYGDAQNVANMSLADIALECADAYGELCDIESNLMTFEAATKIKKAKSGKKKVKVTKKKMSAKAAKAAKKSGKVRRITRESDSELDGGTGPLPTTGDTNGLTDSDLDADPDATVEVTSADDYQPEQADITGIEGVDFEVEYEDPMIQELTFEADNLLKKMGRGLQEFAAKVVQFFQKIYYKINDKFKIDLKWVDAHSEDIDAGLNPSNTFVIKNFNEGLWTAIGGNVSGAIDALEQKLIRKANRCETFAKNVSEIKISGDTKDAKSEKLKALVETESTQDGGLFTITKKQDAKNAQDAAEIFVNGGNAKAAFMSNKKDVKLGDICGNLKSADIKKVLKAGSAINTAVKNLKSAEQSAKKAAISADASSKKMAALKRCFAEMQRTGNSAFRYYFVLRALTMKVAHAAIKEAKDDDDDDE